MRRKSVPRYLEATESSRRKVGAGISVKQEAFQKNGTKRKPRDRACSEKGKRGLERRPLIVNFELEECIKESIADLLECKSKSKGDRLVEIDSGIESLQKELDLLKEKEEEIKQRHRSSSAQAYGQQQTEIGKRCQNRAEVIRDCTPTPSRRSSTVGSSGAHSLNKSLSSVSQVSPYSSCDDIVLDFTKIENGERPSRTVTHQSKVGKSLDWFRSSLQSSVISTNALLDLAEKGRALTNRNTYIRKDITFEKKPKHLQVSDVDSDTEDGNGCNSQFIEEQLRRLKMKSFVDECMAQSAVRSKESVPMAQDTPKTPSKTNDPNHIRNEQAPDRVGMTWAFTKKIPDESTFIAKLNVEDDLLALEQSTNPGNSAEGLSKTEQEYFPSTRARMNKIKSEPFEAQRRSPNYESSLVTQKTAQPKKKSELVCENQGFETNAHKVPKVSQAPQIQSGFDRERSSSMPENRENHISAENRQPEVEVPKRMATLKFDTEPIQSIDQKKFSIRSIIGESKGPEKQVLTNEPSPFSPRSNVSTVSTTSSSVDSVHISSTRFRARRRISIR